MIPPINANGKPAQFARGHSRGGDTSTRFQPGHKMGLIGVAARKRKGTFEGEGHPNWRGGEWADKRGYVRIRISTEQAAIWPTARCGGGGYTIMRSHKVWNEAHPNNIVQTGEQIHHIDKITDNDTPENLLKLSKKEHANLHKAERRRRPRDPVTGRYF